MEKVKKVFLNKVAKVMLTFTLFGGLLYSSATVTSNAFNPQANAGEEVLRNKSTAVEDIVTYSSDINGFVASSKISLIATSLEEEDIEKLQSEGYYIYINNQQSDKNLPEPVVVDEKEIVVSIYSTDNDVLQTIKKLV